MEGRFVEEDDMYRRTFCIGGRFVERTFCREGRYVEGVLWMDVSWKDVLY